MEATLVLLRHGQSTWNAENRFTGWADVGLTDRGIGEARRAGVCLRDAGILPDRVHTSLLRRAIITANVALDEVDRLWVGQQRTWRLNERHYGALTGSDRAVTVERFGAEQVRRWRRSFDVRPPALADVSAVRADVRYRDLGDGEIPRGESLADVQTRLEPYWNGQVVGQLVEGSTVLIAAHGNSLRALVKMIERIGDEEIADVEVQTGVPWVYAVTVRRSGTVAFSAPRTLH